MRGVWDARLGEVGRAVQGEGCVWGGDECGWGLRGVWDARPGEVAGQGRPA